MKTSVFESDTADAYMAVYARSSTLHIAFHAVRLDDARQLVHSRQSQHPLQHPQRHGPQSLQQEDWQVLLQRQCERLPPHDPMGRGKRRDSCILRSQRLFHKADRLSKGGGCQVTEALT